MENKNYHEEKKILNNNPLISNVNQIHDVYTAKKKKNMNVVYSIFLVICSLIAIFFFVTSESVMNIILGVFFSLLALIMIIILFYTNASKPYILDDEEDNTIKNINEENH